MRTTSRAFPGLWLMAFALLAPLPLRAQAGPPRETRPLRKPELVELVKVDPAIHLDVRYAGPNNEFHRTFYTSARAFLQRPAARALARVSKALSKSGYGLLVFDGYRPWRVTKQFWDLTPEDKKLFVADPAKGSRHNRGCAVDLTLYHLDSGLEADMGGAYDEMSKRSYITYDEASKEVLARRDLLRSAMEEHGFFVYPWEWWHFDFKDWREYGIQDIPFEKLAKAG